MGVGRLLVLYTDEQLDEIEQIALTASADTWHSKLDESVDPIEWLIECYDYCKGDKRPLHIVGIGDTENDWLVAAVTGNGPTSEANSKLYSISRDAVLNLVNEVRASRQRTGVWSSVPPGESQYIVKPRRESH